MVYPVSMDTSPREKRLIGPEQAECCIKSCKIYSSSYIDYDHTPPGVHSQVMQKAHDTQSEAFAVVRDRG